MKQNYSFFILNELFIETKYYYIHSDLKIIVNRFAFILFIHFSSYHPSKTLIHQIRSKNKKILIRVKFSYALKQICEQCAFDLQFYIPKIECKKLRQRIIKKQYHHLKKVSPFKSFYFSSFFNLTLEIICKDITPKKNIRSLEESLSTIKKPILQQTKCYLFQSSNIYRLDYLNSITLEEGKILNLLSINSDLIKTKKKFKCRCSKSKCNAKYCDCFSHGQLCGVDCQCTGCMNQQPRQNMQNFHQNKGCKCSKSGCQKNYCQCYQKGQLCGDKCSCLNCKNVAGDHHHNH